MLEKVKNKTKKELIECYLKTAVRWKETRVSTEQLTLKEEIYSEAEKRKRVTMTILRKCKEESRKMKRDA